jgi:hypothetical protein
VSPNYFQPVWRMASVYGRSLPRCIAARALPTRHVAAWVQRARCAVILQIIRSRGPNPLKAATPFLLRLLNVILMFTTKSNIVLRW